MVFIVFPSKWWILRRISIVCHWLRISEWHGMWSLPGNSRERYEGFVLGGIRSLFFFRRVVLKFIFMFKSNRLCKSEKKKKLVGFFSCRQDQKGTGRTDVSMHF